MRDRAVASAAVGVSLLLAGNVCYSDPFAFQDGFEGYSNNTELRAVWDPDTSIFLGRGGGNQYLRRRVSAGASQRANVWVLPVGDLTGDDLAVDVRCTAVNSGWGYFYVRQGTTNFRSITGYQLSTGMDWATLTLADIVPEDFVSFGGGSRRPNLANVSRLGVTFWVNTSGLGTQYMEADNFVVTSEPSVLLTLGAPSLFLTWQIRRRWARQTGSSRREAPTPAPWRGPGG